MSEIMTAAITQIKSEVSDSIIWTVISPSWKANLIHRPFASFGKIHMTTKIDSSTDKDYVCDKLIHEVIHIRQQQTGTVKWLASYVALSKFRAVVEIEAFGAEYTRALKHGAVIDWTAVEDMLVKQYFFAFSKEVAKIFTKSLQAGSFGTIDWKRIVEHVNI
jgi:hypothetical protein